MHREARAACDDEDADRAGDDRGHSAGDQRGVHEVLAEQPLLLAAREPAERRVRVAGRADLVERPLDTGVRLGGKPTRAPAMTVEPEPDEVASTQRKAAVEDALLWHVADARASLARRSPVHSHASRCRFEQAEDDADQRGLAGAGR